MKVGDAVKVVGYQSPAKASLPYVGFVGTVAAIRNEPTTWPVRVEFPDGRTELFAIKELEIVAKQLSGKGNMDG